MAFLEDFGSGDVTSAALIPEGMRTRAAFVAKGRGVAAGVNLPWVVFLVALNPDGPPASLRAGLHAALGAAVAGNGPWRDVERLLRRWSRKISYVQKTKDGHGVTPGTVMARVEGPARTILAGERLAINLLARCSGIATATARLVEAVRGTKAAVFDTRKTTPLWRDIEKMAVRCGGGKSHRRGLYDQILIKDNHLFLGAKSGLFDAAGAVRLAKTAVGPKGIVEIETSCTGGMKKILRENPDIVLLDNMAPAALRKAVVLSAKFEQETGSKPILEASGGIGPTNIREIAMTGVDRISSGFPTHSAEALDISLEFY